MALYTAQTNSPSTTLASAATAAATTLSLTNGDIFSDLTLPNLLTLGYTQANSETVLVTAINGNTATVTRGIDGTATDWAVDTPIARVFTAYDWNTMLTEKMGTAEYDSNGDVATAGGIPTYVSGAVSSELSGYQTKITASGMLKGNGSAVSAATAGTDYVAPSALNSYVPTTRTVNSKALSANITLSASDVSAVPTTRTVNGKALSTNITLSASDVSAVPTTRTINNMALNADLTISRTFTATLTAAGWSSSSGYYTQTVSVSNIKATYSVNPVVDVSLAGNDATTDAARIEAFGLISIVTTAAGSITAKCAGDAPSIDVPIIINVWE